ncbi:MAG TPA: hypothetical protein VJQ84_05580 [Solirubrobacterales bacterium]|nr:hypothetical protein [Solirubrobacterales bacterium]
MNLWRKIGLLVILAAVFAATQAGTASATSLCLTQASFCPPEFPLPVPETVEANMETPWAIFSQVTTTECEVAKMQIKTTLNLGPASPLLASVTPTFGSCRGCTTVKAVNPPFEAKLIPLRDGSPLEYHGNGSMVILKPKFELSGCAGGLVCFDNASSITLEVTGGSPMTMVANVVVMNVSGTSCGTIAKFFAKYAVTSWPNLWLEPEP